MHSPTAAADSTRRDSPFRPGYAALPGYAAAPPGYAALPNFSVPVPHPVMMRGGSRRSMLAGLCTFQAFLLMYLYFFSSSAPCDKGKMIPKEGSQYVYDAENRAYQYDRNMPLIFIGGVPRSGTTLARVMLDAHPSIRCGEETRVIPRILAMQVQWRRSTKEKSRLEEAGVTDEVLDDAISSFVLEVIAKHGEAAPYLCNKDPFTHKSTVYLSSLFPNAKFILMLRDGRAAVHSMITRKVTITGFDLTSYRNSLTKWNQAIENMYSQCVQVGPTKCMPVQYEQLVLHPKEWMERILTLMFVGPTKCMPVQYEQLVLHPKEWMERILTLMFVGPTKCMPVQYEQLVLHPKEWMERILTLMFVGSTKCMPVQYEQLVLHPKEWMERILTLMFVGSTKCMPVQYEQLVIHPKEWMERILTLMFVGPTKCMPVQYEQLVIHPKEWMERILTLMFVGPTKCMPVQYEQLVIHPKEWMERILTLMFVGPTKCMPVQYEQLVIHPKEWMERILTLMFVGPTKCMPVQYEQLVIHPKEWMERILTLMWVPRSACLYSTSSW
ncbi:uncharacterized protein [Branchiostoma lanceolatum]|uniref:uncharacterized protein n=1 Tax=Branchiostoma lanceolatum TaxID=7740 RepID=UPI003452B9D2